MAADKLVLLNSTFLIWVIISALSQH